MTLQEIYDYFKNNTEPKYFLTDVFSWRGNYSDIAFTPSKIGSRCTSLQLIKRALRHSFKGYKGGYYKYSPNTIVHFEMSKDNFNNKTIELI